MKSFTLFLLATFFFSHPYAQRTVPLRNLWAPARVHVMFEGYTVSFAIKDINRAMELLKETGDSSYGNSCGLDTGRDHYYELYPTNMLYKNHIEPLLQNGVGVFLLTAGHAVVSNPRHKLLTDIIVDIVPVENGENTAVVNFYDPQTKKLIFAGRMRVDIYKKDLGIDD